MIRLHQYPPIWDLSSLSPFCIKVEAYLRLTGTPFEVVVENNPLKGPRGRMPFIEDGNRIVSDSKLILDDLEARASDPLDGGLSPEQKAIALAFHRMLDQDLIRVVLYSRWVDPDGWRVLKKEFVPFFPFGLRTIALRLIRRSLFQDADGMGLFEFTREEIYALGAQHLEAISAYLGEKPYFLGDRPTTLDASLYAFLSVILETPIPVPLRARALELENLVRYRKRIRSLF